LVQRSRCAVFTTLRFFALSPDGVTVKCSDPMLSPGFALPSESFRANPSRPAEACAAPLMGFVSLQHIRQRRSSRAGFACPHRFRLQGLITLVTVFSLHGPAGFVSRRRRSWDSPFGAFSACKVAPRFRCAEPACRLPADRHARRGEDREPQSRGFRVLTLAGIPSAAAKD